MLPADSTVYIGCIGKDKYGEMLKDITAKAGVRTEYRYDDEAPTGRCGVVITGHNRSLCTDLAAANLYKLDHLKSPEIWKLVENAKFFYVGGYHLTVCVPAILALAEEAASKNKVCLYSHGACILAGNLLTCIGFHPQLVRSLHPAVLQGRTRPDPPLR